MFMRGFGNYLPWASMADELNRFSREFNRYFGGGHNYGSGFPAFNVWSNAEGSILTAELPGVKMEDLEVTVSGNNVTIKGVRNEELPEGSSYSRRERRFGEFVRTIELPFRVEAAGVEAKMALGVLHVTLPRAESDKPRKIAVAKA